MTGWLFLGWSGGGGVGSVKALDPVMSIAPGMSPFRHFHVFSSALGSLLFVVPKAQAQSSVICNEQ